MKQTVHPLQPVDRVDFAYCAFFVVGPACSWSWSPGGPRTTEGRHCCRPCRSGRHSYRSGCSSRYPSDSICSSFYHSEPSAVTDSSTGHSGHIRFWTEHFSLKDILWFSVSQICLIHCLQSSHRYVAVTRKASHPSPPADAPSAAAAAATTADGFPTDQKCWQTAGTPAI